MRKIQILAALVLMGFITGPVWAQSESSPAPFALTYFEFYGTPIEPQAYAQIDTDALGLNVLAEYNPSFYASFGLNYERTTFYDGFNSTASFLGLEARFFGAPNGKAPFAPYIYGGAGMGLNTGTGNELKAGLGSRLQLAYPFFLDFSAGSNWIDSGLQFLTFRGGLSVSFDLPKVEPSPAAKPTKVETPVTSVTPVGTLVDLLASPSPTNTPAYTATVQATDTPTLAVTSVQTATFTPTVVESPVVTPSPVKQHYKLGMAAFNAHHYLTATAEFKKALVTDDPAAVYYFYAESDAMLGVIYQFYSKVPGHNKIAIKYYKKALKVDPMTKTAKKYLKMLQSGKPSPKAPDQEDIQAGTEDGADTTNTVKANSTDAASTPQAVVSPAAKADSN